MSRALEWMIIAFFVGVAFVVVSNLIGVFSYELCWSPADAGRLMSCAGSETDLVRKQVGFFPALNWSLTLVFFFPMFVFFALRSIELAGDALAKGISRGMIRRVDWSSADLAGVLTVTLRRMRLVLICMAAVFLIALIFVGRDFYVTISRFYNDPQLLGGIQFPNPEWSVDWTMADALCRHVSGGPGGCNLDIYGRSANEIFAAVAYLYLPGLGSVAAIGFMVGFGLFATLFNSREFERAGYVIVPDVRSADRRGGFEIFEPLFQHAIIACLTLFAMGYLVALQNVYLQTPHTNILDLIVPVDFSSLAAAVPQLPRYINPRIAAVSMIALLFLAIVVVAAVSALNTAARGGRDRVLEVIKGTADERKKLAKELGIVDLEESKQRLEQVAPWPLNWPSVTTLIIWLVAATISMLVVSAGLYVIAAAIIFAFGEVTLKKLKGQ
jgi:hypothetical protein